LATASKQGPEDARRANRSLLLRALHHGGPTSRADLAKLTGLTPASVSSVVRDLLDQELVEELGTRVDGGVGKPATLVGIRPDSRYVVCLDLSEPEQFVAGLVDLTGKVVVRRSYARDERTGRRAETLVKRICHDLVADADRPLLGIGVASPGIVDDQGTVTTAAHLGWTDLDLGVRLSARASVPVHVVNDANAAALAELVFGAGEAQNLILVRVDEGVGAGLVLDGALFTGNRSAAGEIGHVVIEEHGEPCACGKRGCLETVVSEPLLGKRLGADGADEADVLGHAGSRLGVALSTVLGALDICDVVLSGPASVTSEAFRNATRDEIAARTMPNIADRLVVRPSTFGFDDVLIGAAALVLDRELGIH
jgi:predicted NBD/HSP70 family sugar kinase